MQAEIIDKIQNLSNSASKVGEDTKRLYFAIGGKIHPVEKINTSRGHIFSTLAGFVAYLNSDRSGDKPAMVFVGPSAIHAELDYMADIRQMARLDLGVSEEFAALNLLMAGVAQKTLWRLLLTKLSGCIDTTLMIQTANLNIKATSDSDIQIQATGVKNEKSDSSIKITWTDPKDKGSKTADVRTSWIWTGRIWEAFDRTFEIPLTMEIDVENGMKFIFHPDRLDFRLREARLALVDSVGKALAKSPRFAVHEGTF